MVAADRAAFVGVAASLLLVGLFVLALASARWLEGAGLPEEWSLLLVGGVIVVAGAAFALIGVGRIKAGGMVPDRTLDQLRSDLTVAKEHVR